jgi:uncharacterized SAM-binding protein YcdF (DUF218 family)
MRRIFPRAQGGVGRRFAAVTAFLAAFWFAGFVWFADDAVRAPPMPPVADGIVVLTGGADRIATAILLLRGGRGRLLLISGVGPGAELDKLFRGTGVDPAGLRDRVTLGREATDTAGNAAETADWVRENGLHSLIVVTAGYHMQRALTELGRDVPDVTFYPVPVMPPALREVRRLGTLRLLADEYTKWLAAQVGLTRLHG